MGITERRERQKQALRQEILDAARELFAREGYENVTMRRIAEKIEYSPTTIYLYFKDKMELLEEICEQTFHELLLSLKQRSEEESDPVVGLKKGLRAYVDFGVEHAQAYKVTFMLNLEQHATPEEYQDPESAGCQTYQYLLDAVQGCLAAGRFRPANEHVVSQALWAAVHGITSLLIAHPAYPWADPNVVIDALIDGSVRGFEV